ncbi:MAG: Sinorhizobium phage phiM12 [Bacteroidota bacterium]|jgi:hypothetical protein
MKVHIGPYTNWIGPYQIANAIFFWVDRHGIWLDNDPRYERWDYKASEKLGDWLASTWVNDFCNWIDSKKKRKINVRIDPYDTWSMDHTLALIIHPMLVQLKATNHGYFSSDAEDAPHIGKGESDEYDMSDSNTEARYNWIMDELIWTFDQLIDDEKEFQFYKNGEWDLEGSKAYNDRIKNGLRLFGKYYRGLWD